MMKNNMLPLAACVGMALALASCQGTDTRKAHRVHRIGRDLTA